MSYNKIYAYLNIIFNVDFFQEYYEIQKTIRPGSYYSPVSCRLFLKQMNLNHRRLLS